MFQDLNELNKNSWGRGPTTPARLLHYLSVFVLSVVLFGGLWIIILE